MKMKKRWIAVIAPFALALFIWIGGEVVMHLWNWLLPPLFGWKLIGFWQALGLLVLCRVLFGGWGGGGGPRGKRRRHFDERWERMTPEEREKTAAELARPLREHSARSLPPVGLARRCRSSSQPSALSPSARMSDLHWALELIAEGRIFISPQ